GGAQAVREHLQLPEQRLLECRGLQLPVLFHELRQPALAELLLLVVPRLRDAVGVHDEGVAGIQGDDALLIGRGVEEAEDHAALFRRAPSAASRSRRGGLWPALT